MKQFKLYSNYKPAGDQPKAIEQLVEGIRKGVKHQVLLGVTGSGKTFTISNVIEQVQKPVLVISPNKTLAAQLYSEFRNFFPENAVEYFISYYDYYQPEAYIPQTDTYIEKDFSINDEIDRLRIKATSRLVENRRDVIIVASVSCIYSIGKKEEFEQFIFPIHKGMQISRKALMNKLIYLYYNRNDVDFKRGCFRVRGDIIDLIPAYEIDTGIRIELFGDEIDKISLINTTTGKVLKEFDEDTIYPAKLFVTTESRLQRAIVAIQNELVERLRELRSQGKLLEAQRLEQRTLYDIEMMKEIGYCSGIENYSMHLSGRNFGDTPETIIHYFPKDFLTIIDESHVTIPQLRGMYNGDRSRKQTLVDFGFRLPSALENRPLKFEEFEQLVNQVIYVSATPGPYELEKTGGVVVEQIIRPTGLVDPEISVRPIRNQVDDLIDEIRQRVKKGHRVLVTTLTKRMAEDLAEYLHQLNIKVAYIHSDIDALERVEIIRDLRLGNYDVLVGVNLLREGLDLPEVSLVAILDADKEGFLRSERSLLQIAGRTARNVDGLVILYADKITNSIKNFIEETNRRRKIQLEYNRINNINPQTVYKTLEEILSSTSIADIQMQRQQRKAEKVIQKASSFAEPLVHFLNEKQKEELIEQLFKEMKEAARNLDFERAAEIRDEIARLKGDNGFFAKGKKKLLR
ncbi:excinuclease ABC subunit UvrB [Bacteroidetes/Chlorobi group bacterium MS-B_bin-24]|jgi:excinuclease ABC subunit B|nr:MAG: excinuclease ABC subunit UvrB [Bacteroidetes/Chlorobi group bacterium MS-B_bin-24]